MKAVWQVKRVTHLPVQNKQADRSTPVRKQLQNQSARSSIRSVTFRNATALAQNSRYNRLFTALAINCSNSHQTAQNAFARAPTSITPKLASGATAQKSFFFNAKKTSEQIEMERRMMWQIIDTPKIRRQPVSQPASPEAC